MSKSTYCYYKETKHLRAEKRRTDKDSQILTKAGLTKDELLKKMKDIGIKLQI